jgi:hypothetical protein
MENALIPVVTCQDRLLRAELRLAAGFAAQTHFHG